jgi:hypothetical protein
LNDELNALKLQRVGINYMEKIIFFFLQLLVTPLLADEVDIKIGDTSITVPSPNGFLPVTGNMFMVNQFLENMVAPQNIRFISFIPEQTLPAIRRGEMPDLTHNVSVQTEKDVVNATITKADFEQFKKLMHAQNDELVNQVENEAPGLMDKFNKGIGNDFNVNPDVNFKGFIMLPAHDESDRLFAFSSYVNLSARTRDGTLTNLLGTVTSTCLFTKAKIFFIYVNGTSKELQWTRQVSKDWAAAILAANPSDAATIVKESASPVGFNWNRVFLSALIGGIFGGLLGLVRYLFRRKKSN